MIITRRVSLRSSALQDRCGTDRSTTLLVSRLPIHRCGFRTVKVFFPSEAVKVEGALSDYTSRAASGNLMHRQFCPTCGTPVFTLSDARRQVIGVRADTLDDPEIGKPQMTIWTSSAPSWAAFDPNIRRDEKQSPPPQ